MKRSHGPLLLALFFAAAPAAAQEAQRPSPLVVTAVNLMAGDQQHKAWADKGGKASDVLPGDVIRYELRFTNTTDQPVRNVVFSNPVPKGLQYVPASATAAVPSVAVTYSIDGGLTYSAQPMIEVVENGQRKNVPAPPERYTHVRWTVEGSIQSGAQVTAEFRAVLPAPRGKS
jgi:uncharacterized repeat protein (TIGR01451 family)